MSSQKSYNFDFMPICPFSVAYTCIVFALKNPLNFDHSWSCGASLFYGDLREEKTVKRIRYVQINRKNGAYKNISNFQIDV